MRSIKNWGKEMNKKPTYNDFQNYSPKELQKHYKLDNRALEREHRRVLDGASQSSLTKEYEKFYSRNRRDA